MSGEALADELDELPLPHRFDVVSAEALSDGPLREQIAQTGVTLYERRLPEAPCPGSF